MDIISSLVVALQKEQDKNKELEERIKRLETILMNTACQSDGLYVRVTNGRDVYTNTLSGYLMDDTDYKFELLSVGEAKK